MIRMLSDLLGVAAGWSGHWEWGQDHSQHQGYSQSICAGKFAVCVAHAGCPHPSAPLNDELIRVFGWMETPPAVLSLFKSFESPSTPRHKLRGNTGSRALKALQHQDTSSVATPAAHFNTFVFMGCQSAVTPLYGCGPALLQVLGDGSEGIFEVTALSTAAVEKAKEMIEGIVTQPEVDQIYE